MNLEVPLPAPDGSRPDPNAPALIRLRQATRALFRSVTGEVSLILRVDSGIKRLSCQGRRTEVPEGTLALMPAFLPMDVENHPGAGGFYRATGLLLPPGITVPRGSSTSTVCDDPRALAAFDRALVLHRRTAVPHAIRAHATAEVLLWLDAAGLRLPPEAPPALPDRVRALTGSALDRSWRANEVAARLGVSAPTLRRHLAAAGISFAALLADQRMNRALGLLQATDLPVGVIAGEVGYASATRFAARFRTRFGLLPSAIRGDRQVDRSGTEIERNGRIHRTAAW
jgi:AraC-like DNA-binding protein